MKRFLTVCMIFAMLLTLLAGCKSAGGQEESAIAGDLVGGSSQENAGQNSEGPQKVENQQGSNNEQPDEPQGGNDQPGNDEPQGGNDQPTNDSQGGSNEQPSNQPQDDQNGEDGEDPYAAMKADQSGTKIKILCQNLRCDAKADQGTDNDARVRRYRFQSLVEKYDPDIIASQECDATWIDFLQQDYSANYGMFYKYREDGNDEACPILWKLDKYEKLDQGYFWLSKTPNVSSPSYEEGQMARITNWVYLKDKATGSKFYIYSAHYGFYENDSSIAGIRDQVINAFKTVPNDAYAFHMGDYNFGVEGKQYYVYTDALNILDLRTTALEMARNEHCTMGDIRNGTYNGFKPENADGAGGGDYIMTAPRKNQTIDFYGYLYDQLGNEKAGVQKGFIADHFGLYTEVRIDTDVSYQEYWGDNAK